MKDHSSLHTNPFFLLNVTSRDDRRTIVEKAEERALHVSHDICQKARSDLTNPRSRLSAEMAWLPGIAPSAAEKLVHRVTNSPLSIRSVENLPELSRANLMAALFELIEPNQPPGFISELIQEFAWVVDEIDPEAVLRDINEDRAISGFPEVKDVGMIQAELLERRKFYRSVLKDLLDEMEPVLLIETMTATVSDVTADGEVHGRALIDDLVDSYEIETQGFLNKESENIATLVDGARQAAPRGHAAISPYLDKLEQVARNWDKVAQPIQLSAKSRGIQHTESRDIAFKLRSLAVDLVNEHAMLDQAHRMTNLLQDLFAELPDVVERLGEDAEVLDGLRRQVDEQKRNKEKWERDITFHADIGTLFKERLSISPDGIRWKDIHFPLDAVTRVRWGGVRNSINGIPTGTDYWIGVGDNRTEQTIKLSNEAIYSRFLEALWRAVCVRLIFNILDALEKGKSLCFGDFTVFNDSAVLVRHKFLGSEPVRVKWNEVSVWSANGCFVIGKTDDKKVYGKASYIDAWNAHILEHIVRGGFKKGVSRLSDYLKD